MKNINWTNLLMELIVVIIGVTGAFSLNEWKDRKKAEKMEHEYLLSFKSDLEKDTTSLATFIDTLTYQKNNCQQLINCIFNNDFENESLLQYSISLFFVTAFVPHSATYKSLASSGQLQTITDFELRKSLVDQYDISYTYIRLLDDFNQNQVFNYKTPFLHDNLRYTRNGIVNTEVMTTSKYINMTMSTFYFLEKKIDEYTKAKVNAVELIAKLEDHINNN